MSKTQGVTEILQLLPHARDVQDYLIVFSAAMTGKKKPPADYIHNLNKPSDIFVDYRDIENVVSLIGDVFREKGYRTPWQLEDDLIQKIQPGIPKEAIAIANHYAASLLIPDQMAAYLQKPCVPLMMGLGALYNQVTGNPVSVVEIDFSNMRGTNNHNARLIAVTRDVGFDEAMTEAEAMTDQVAFIIAQTIKRKSFDLLGRKENLKIIGLRTGGDELRLVIPDVAIDQAEGILPGIHDAIETVTARTGGHDHEHTKEDCPFRGFSAAAGVFALEAMGHNDFKQRIEDVGCLIKERKIQVGAARANNNVFDEMKPCHSKAPDLYINKGKALEYLAEVQEAIAEIRRNLIVDLSDLELEADMVASEDIVDFIQSNHFLTSSQIQHGFRRQLHDDLEKKGLSLNADQIRLLSIKTTKFPTMDYATGTLSERDFPAMAGAALKVTDNLNKFAGTNLPPIILGASFHNLAGLNDTLGHEEANEVLHHLVQRIVVPALEKEGIARENMVLAHIGGGEIRAIIQPMVYDSDGYHRTIDPELSTACRLISEETEKLSARKFSHVLNPREKLRPHENGVTVSIVAGPYQEKKIDTPGLWRGGMTKTYMDTLLRKVIDARRDGYAASTWKPNMSALKQA